MITTFFATMVSKAKSGGVRRYQNPDGSLTEAGKARYIARRNVIRNRPYTDAKNDIVRSLSDKEKKLLGASLNEDWIEKDYEAETLSNLAKIVCNIIRGYANFFSRDME